MTRYALTGFTLQLGISCSHRIVERWAWLACKLLPLSFVISLGVKCCRGDKAIRNITCILIIIGNSTLQEHNTCRCLFPRFSLLLPPPSLHLSLSSSPSISYTFCFLGFFLGDAVMSPPPGSVLTSVVLM